MPWKVILKVAGSFRIGLDIAGDVSENDPTCATKSAYLYV